MSLIEQMIIRYVLVINAIALMMFGIDKWKAQHGKWRIPEATLLGLAVIGGSLGAWAAMYSFRHKTQHLKFKYGVPAIIILQIAAACYFYFK